MTIEFECESDTEAITRALRHDQGGSMELCNRTRVVKAFPEPRG